MGFNVNEGYYERHVKQEGYKITDEQGKINATNMNDVRSGIKIAEQQYAKDRGIELPKNQETSKEPIEYVIEESQPNHDEMEL